MFANFCLFSRRARRSLYHFFCIAFVSSRLHACTQRHTNPRSSHRHYHYHFASPARWCRCRRGPLGVVDTCLFAWRRCRTRRWAVRISPRGCTCGPEARGAPCRVSYWRIRRVDRCRTDNRRRSGRNDDSSTRWTLRDMCSLVCPVVNYCGSIEHVVLLIAAPISFLPRPDTRILCDCEKPDVRLPVTGWMSCYIRRRVNK